VVDKSGSLMVNVKGSDVNFSTDIKDGLSHLFLYETNQQWYQTEILAIKTFDEKQALFYESKIAENFKLFES
jgi:hypothetical protein